MGDSGSPEDNLKRAEGAILQNEADLYVFPELFLSSYDTTTFNPEDTPTAEKRLRLLCGERDCAVAIGAPVQWYNGVTDSLLFITPTETFRYDKIYLANFGIYNESAFEPGKSPAIVEWKGMKIGLEICYDVTFPELHRFYATHDCDIVIVSAASAEPSKKVLMNILPTRSVENTVYTVYVNSIGKFKDT
ncbi:putative amidohydrolase [Thermoplasmatales archaeon BRNA1]|nr:putative amidohydrolase [Thermoplasmatales archaeon BRNA1]